MVIEGGGYIAIEFAFIFANLGQSRFGLSRKTNLKII